MAAGRLRFPREVIGELERYTGPENLALNWAKSHQGRAVISVDFADVKAVLADVPEVLDVDKEGAEEADVYVLAMAMACARDGHDARIVTEEFKTTVRKMNLGSAAGYLGIPSVALRTLLKFEQILKF